MEHVSDEELKKASPSIHANRIWDAARRAEGYHGLIVHVDADYSTADRARRDRIDPGFELIRQSSERVCDQLVPLIPVRMTEAWMLADRDVC